MERFIYKEDNQGYYFIPVVFETDAKITSVQMKNISYKLPGAGTHSTSFESFKILMKSQGYTVNEIKRLPKNRIPSSNTLEIVMGATGNY